MAPRRGAPSLFNGALTLTVTLSAKRSTITAGEIRAKEDFRAEWTAAHGVQLKKNIYRQCLARTFLRVNFLLLLEIRDGPSRGYLDALRRPRADG